MERDQTLDILLAVHMAQSPIVPPLKNAIPCVIPCVIPERSKGYAVLRSKRTAALPRPAEQNRSGLRVCNRKT
jgi:hypothetical protein